MTVFLEWGVEGTLKGDRDEPHVSTMLANQEIFRGKAVSVPSWRIGLSDPRSSHRRKPYWIIAIRGEFSFEFAAALAAGYVSRSGSYTLMTLCCIVLYCHSRGR